MKIKLEFWVDTEEPEKILAAARLVADRDWSFDFDEEYEDLDEDDKVRVAVELLYEPAPDLRLGWGISTEDSCSEILSL